ncbi:patatin-like phospholipase family protein [Peribacillus asahii]|uniref:patatin-like phospholipase family protein n=1 Tax=Peribacillus asahii TaxID=228899 RepID=UPI0037F2FE60
MIIDGVFSGGGIKGFGLVGGLQVLEERGYTFQRTAGTSAGSIIAALVVAGYSSKQIEELFRKIDTDDLLDRRRGWSQLPFAKWLLLYWKLGLYKGDALEAWVAEQLKMKGVVTFQDIPPNSLRIITSDITNGRLVVLPNDLSHYGIESQSFSVAKAVRMSCSVPYFFEPVKIKTGNQTNVFVDGGVLSNFPMWLFNTDRGTRERPVIGLKLTGDEVGKAHEVDDPIEMFTALFKTMTNAHDSRYISKKHVNNIAFIPMKGISGLDFKLNEEKKDELIQRGRVYTTQFLKRWSY